MPKATKEQEVILREHATSVLTEVEIWLERGNREAAINEIQEYGAAEFSHGFASGEVFAQKLLKKMV